MYRELQLCHAVLQRIKGMSRYVPRDTFLSSVAPLVVGACYSTAALPAVPASLSIWHCDLTQQSKQTSGTTLLIHIFS